MFAFLFLDSRGATGFDPGYSATNNDLATFGIITGAGLASLLLSRLLPRKWCIGWWLGWALLGPLAGISAAFTMLLLKSGGNLLFKSTVGRWVLAAILAVIGLVAVTLTKWTGAVRCSFRHS